MRVFISQIDKCAMNIILKGREERERERCPHFAKRAHHFSWWPARARILFNECFLWTCNAHASARRNVPQVFKQLASLSALALRLNVASFARASNG